MTKKKSACEIIGLAILVSVALQPLVVATPCQARPKTESAYTVHEEVIEGRHFNVTRGLVKARPQEVWQVLTDYANASRVFPMLKKCQVVEDRGSTKIMKHVVSPSGIIGTYEYTIELKENHEKELTWKRLSGAFKEVAGYWRIEPADNGLHSLVTYATHVNGGLFIPQGLIKRQFRIDMPQVMHLLVARAEGARHIASRQQAQLP